MRSGFAGFLRAAAVAAATCSTAAAARESVWPHQLRPCGQRSITAVEGTLLARIYRKRMDGPAELVAGIDRTDPACAPSGHRDEEIELPLVRRGCQYFIRGPFGTSIPDGYGLKVACR